MHLGEASKRQGSGLLAQHPFRAWSMRRLRVALVRFFWSAAVATHRTALSEVVAPTVSSVVEVFQRAKKALATRAQVLEHQAGAEDWWLEVMESGAWAMKWKTHSGNGNHQRGTVNAPAVVFSFMRISEGRFLLGVAICHLHDSIRFGPSSSSSKPHQI